MSLLIALSGAAVLLPAGQVPVKAAETAQSQLTVDDIVRVQPYSQLTYYAEAVTKIVITYRDGAGVSGVTANTYHLEDRGYLHPEFGQLPIKEVEVDGHVVTLTIDRDTTANTDNARIYSGADKTGDRTKDDIFGVHATFSWYRELDGDIVEAARAFQFAAERFFYQIELRAQQCGMLCHMLGNAFGVAQEAYVTKLV